MFEKVVVIDGKDHICGRLAAVVAKQLLSGQRVVIVRAERVILTGQIERHIREWLLFTNRQSNCNPAKGGPWHLKAPAKLIWRTIRGMLPHKTARGAAALARLKVFEGCPHPYSVQKKVVVTNALRAVMLDSFRKYTYLGDFSSRVGWNHGPTVAALEAKRKERSAKFYQDKVKIKLFRPKLLTA
jgi:large subunit ribosomal protein L13Ae